MNNENVKNLVICSTLNQITNYLVIKKYEPVRVINITFDEDIKFAMNIEPKKWDKRLAKELYGKDDFEKKNTVELYSEDIYYLNDLKEKLKVEILHKIGKKEVTYWHVTGGQRTIALAIIELLKEEERINDKIVYIEGNTEKLIINDFYGELLDNRKIIDDRYNYKELTFKNTLNLVGFDTHKLNSTTRFKEQGESKIDQTNKNKEYQFYKMIYSDVIMNNRDKKLTISNVDFNYENEKTYCDTFRNLLLKSNNYSWSKEKKIRFIKCLFKSLLKEYPNLEKNYNDDADEIKNGFPAGYIFEKIVAYRIYDLIKDKANIVGMETSLKTFFDTDIIDDKNDDGSIKDEIDIALLTDTGKIINFECKSGGMQGDNAKSTKYTTYRLSGVFGMPILMSPLYEDEFLETDNKDLLKKQMQAVRAANAAELEVIAIDKIDENRLEKLRILRSDENEED